MAVTPTGQAVPVWEMLSNIMTLFFAYFLYSEKIKVGL
jgi:hypothetical protein